MNAEWTEWRGGFLSGIFDGEKEGTPLSSVSLGWGMGAGLFGDGGHEEDIHVIIQLPQKRHLRDEL